MDENIFEKIKNSHRAKDAILLKSLVKKILASIIDSQKSSKSFFYHPLGFIYCKLHEFENRETIRLHIWDREMWNRKPLLELHNHFYIVNSFVIYGHLTNITYKTSSKAIANYAIYKGEYNAIGERLLKKTANTIFAEIALEETIKANNFYTITCDEIHSSLIEDDFVCTVVYTETPGSPEPMVLGPLDGDLEYYYPNKNLQDKEVIELIKKIDQYLII